MIPKLFKLDIGNDYGISYKWHGFELKGQRSTLVLGLTAIRRGFEVYECLLVIIIIIITFICSIHTAVWTPCISYVSRMMLMNGVYRWATESSVAMDTVSAAHTAGTIKQRTPLTHSLQVYLVTTALQTTGMCTSRFLVWLKYELWV